MTTRIEIIDRALIRIGALPLQVETARGASQRIAEYADVVGGLMSHPWTFATRVRQLSQLSGTAQPHWTYRYALPADMIGAPRAVYESGDLQIPSQSFELRAAESDTRPGELLSSATAVWLRYTVNCAPQFWPAYFASLVVMALAAEFSLSVREDHPMRERLRREVYDVGGMLERAKTLDAQAKPSPRLAISGNPLIDVRR